MLWSNKENHRFHLLIHYKKYTKNAVRLPDPLPLYIELLLSTHHSTPATPPTPILFGTSEYIKPETNIEVRQKLSAIRKSLIIKISGKHILHSDGITIEQFVLES